MGKKGQFQKKGALFIERMHFVSSSAQGNYCMASGDQKAFLGD